MEVHIKTYQEVQIKMSGKEASWLKHYLQDTSIASEEFTEYADYKMKLFNILKAAGVE